MAFDFFFLQFCSLTYNHLFFPPNESAKYDFKYEACNSPLVFLSLIAENKMHKISIAHRAQAPRYLHSPADLPHRYKACS